MKSIANSILLALGCNVEVRISIASLSAEEEKIRFRKCLAELLKPSTIEQRNFFISTEAQHELESTAMKFDKKMSHRETIRVNSLCYKWIRQ